MCFSSVFPESLFQRRRPVAHLDDSVCELGNDLDDVEVLLGLDQVENAIQNHKDKKAGVGPVRWWQKIQEQQVRGKLTAEWLQQFTKEYVVLEKKQRGTGVTRNDVTPLFEMLGLELKMPRRVFRSF
jgi:hypothetical protein